LSLINTASKSGVQSIADLSPKRRLIWINKALSSVIYADMKKTIINEIQIKLTPWEKRVDEAKHYINFCLKHGVPLDEEAIEAMSDEELVGCAEQMMDGAEDFYNLSVEKKWVGEFAPNLGHDPNNPFPLKSILNEPAYGLRWSWKFWKWGIEVWQIGWEEKP